MKIKPTIINFSMTLKRHFLLITLMLTTLNSALHAQNFEPLDISEEWVQKITDLAPSEPTVKGTAVKKILVFSKATGFAHWTIPHNITMLKILAKKTKAFELVIAYDVEKFSSKSLNKYDAIILNNCNPKGPKRDIFYDLLLENTTLTLPEIETQAATYAQNVIDYVSKGHGLVVLHGAIVVQNNSEPWSAMVGGSFNYHPKQQEMHVREIDENHPLTQAFSGDGFTHVDEPYYFNGTYDKTNFRPLLYIENSKIEGIRHEVSAEKNYVSWIIRHGKGRVFYTSPSHNAHSLENPEFLKFILNGIQYAVGDLPCDDSPLAE